MAQIVIADITVYDQSIPGTKVLRYATQGYVTGASDTPAHTCYESRILQPANISRQAFSYNSTSGETQVGYGEMILVNPDGGLDALIDYSFSGRDIEIKLGEVFEWSSSPTWTTVIKGVMEQVEFSWNQISIRIRDKQQDLTVPLQGNTYGGTNALPAGVDGTADDLKGRRKPLLFGKARGIAPPCVNTSKLIYQINDGAINSVDAVYDRGVVLTAGATYADQAAMEATAPAAGQYRVWLAGGMFRLGSAPAGTVTCDATQGAAAANRTSAQLMNAVLTKAGISAGSIESADITALDSAVSSVCGVYVPHDSDTSGAAVLDFIANSVGAWWGADRLGKFRMGRIVAPTSGSVGTITAVEIISIDRQSSSDIGAGVPSWRVTVGWGRVYSPQTDLAGSVSAAEKARMGEEYRTAQAADASVKTVNLYSPEMRFDTALSTEADAVTEASRRLDLYKIRRDTYQVRVRLDGALAAAVDIGKVITLELPRYGLSAGKLFVILGIAGDLRNNIFDLTLWG